MDTVEALLAQDYLKKKHLDGFDSYKVSFIAGFALRGVECMALLICSMTI